MRTTRRFNHVTQVVMAVAALLAVAACYGGARDLFPPTELADSPAAASPSAAPAPTASTAPRSTGRCGSATLSIDYAPFTTATLAGLGWDFVVAAVVGFEPAIFNTEDGSRPPGFPARPTSPRPNGNAQTTIYTPVNVVIDRTISGPWRPGTSQFLIEGGTVPLEGGPVDCYTFRVYPAPQVEPGSPYVFILSEALDDAGESTLPLHKARFAWPVDPSGFVPTPDGRLSIDELTRIVQDATPSTQPHGTLLP